MAPLTEPLADDDRSERRNVDAREGQIVSGTYRITRHIGSGGSGHVYAAEHLRLGKAFAIKLLRTELDSSHRAAQRFRREAKAVARLRSEHIVSVVDCGELDDQTPYLVMELLEGEDLRSLLKRQGALPPRRAVQIVLEACHGLTVVHEAGLVHRDLKPENLFISRRGTGEDWCKVLDFGVAKMETSMSTAQGAIIGTVRYMAPEQLANADAVGPPTDVHALGAVLFECLTGRPLVDGSTVQEVMYRIMNVEPPQVQELVATVPGSIVRIVNRCVAKAPAARPGSAGELAKLLAATLTPQFRSSSHDTQDDNELTRPVPQPAPADRRRRSLAIASVGSLLLAGLVGWFLRGTSLSVAVAPRPPAPLVARPEVSAAVGRPLMVEAPATGAAQITAPPADRTERIVQTKPSASLEHVHFARPQTEAVAPGGARKAGAAGRFDSTNPYEE